MRKIETLSKSHDRQGFECGREPLNLFLQQTARQHEERGISRALVLVDEDAGEPKPILGFFSLNICQMKPDSLSAEGSKRLPRDGSAVRLGRLAVAKDYKRQGFGRIHLMGAMTKFTEIFNKAGGIGLFVHANDHEAEIYYQQFGFVTLPAMISNCFCPQKQFKKQCVRNFQSHRIRMLPAFARIPYDPR